MEPWCKRQSVELFIKEMVMLCWILCCQAIQNPSDEALQEQAWAAVVPLVGKLKKFYEFSQRLGRCYHLLLPFLTAVSLSPSPSLLLLLLSSSLSSICFISCKLSFSSSTLRGQSTKMTMTPAQTYRLIGPRTFLAPSQRAGRRQTEDSTCPLLTRGFQW